MNPNNLLNALRGVTGEYEIQRILGGLGTTVWIVLVPVFVKVGVFGEVSLTEFALTYPAGIGACMGVISTAVIFKDRATAAARSVEAGTEKLKATTAAKFPEQHEPPPEDALAGAQEIVEVAQDRRDEIKDDVDRGKPVTTKPAKRTGGGG